MPDLQTINQNWTALGRLQVGVFEINVGRPISDVIIQVTERDCDTLIEEMITDISGQTPVINLPAPPKEFSLSPDMPQPFSVYDISVLLNGHLTRVIEGAQIFANNTSFQDIRLSPDDDGEVRVIEIRPPVLWGDFLPKIPEAEVKELPPPLGAVVLPTIVVPEYIIVHDGAPSNASAPNYWVPFKDYIKNVASCEIYPTWPEATLMANILAIQSFTLNRVYTEWYRGKGYNFTITSSTAYDHAFQYGRDIFDQISVIVDNLFTTFITKPGLRQPLLAQYCDGKRVNCPGWMTQWGSMSLGEQGYPAMDILRYYYGSEIFLMQAERVAGVPRSFPGTNLQTGSTGQHVRVIQEQLNAIANNYPAIPRVRVDGIFGPATRKAVEVFQQVFRLSVDGIVGFATWYRISNIYVAVTRMAEL